MLRPARAVRAGERIAYNGGAVMNVAVVQFHRHGTVRIISSTGDALEVVATEPLDLIGGP